MADFQRIGEALEEATLEDFLTDLMPESEGMSDGSAWRWGRPAVVIQLLDANVIFYGYGANAADHWVPIGVQDAWEHFPPDRDPDGAWLQTKANVAIRESRILRARIWGGGVLEVLYERPAFVEEGPDGGQGQPAKIRTFTYRGRFLIQWLMVDLDDV